MIRNTGYKPAFLQLECELVLMHYGYTSGIFPLVIFIHSHTRDYKALNSHVIP